MRTDKFYIDVATDHLGESRILFLITVNVQTLVCQIANARGETKPQQMHEGEYMVGESSRVSVVFLNPQVGFMIQKSV